MNKIKIELTEDQIKRIIDDMNTADPNHLFLDPYRVRIINRLNKALAKAKS